MDRGNGDRLLAVRIELLPVVLEHATGVRRECPEGCLRLIELVPTRVEAPTKDRLVEGSAENKWVSTRVLGDRSGQSKLRLRPSTLDRLDELIAREDVDVVPGEHRTEISGDPTHMRSSLDLLVEGDGTNRRDDQRRQRTLQERIDEIDRVFVGPMRVIDDDDPWDAVARQSLQEPACSSIGSKRRVFENACRVDQDVASRVLSAKPTDLVMGPLDLLTSLEHDSGDPNRDSQDERPEPTDVDQAKEGEDQSDEHHRDSPQLTEQPATASEWVEDSAQELLRRTYRVDQCAGRRAGFLVESARDRHPRK